jgi:hypothetical protein
MRRTRIAATTVMVAAGLMGAVAASASADPPTYEIGFTCEADFGPVSETLFNFTQREANEWIREEIGCLPGTKDILFRVRL